MTAEIINSTDFTNEQALGCEFYGWYRNHWRGRIVEVRKHPTNKGRVITIGYVPRDGKLNGLLSVNTAAKVIICDEEMTETYKQYIKNDFFPDYH